MRESIRRYSRRDHCYILAIILLISYVVVCLNYAHNLVDQYHKRSTTGLIHKHIKPYEIKWNDVKSRVQGFSILNNSKKSLHAVDDSRVAFDVAFDDVISENQRVLTDVLGRILKHFKYILLVDIAVHENKGDAAIAVGELLLLKKLDKKIIFYCNTNACDDRSMKAAKTRALQYGVNHVAVLCHGGGNLIGYRQHDTLRARVFEVFQGFKRVVLPQSIWLQSQAQHKDTWYVLRSHQNVTLLLRDSVSFDSARTHFPFNEKILAPDSAFMIGSVKRSMRPFHDILWLRRTDVEKMNYVVPDFPPNISVSVSDWTKWITAKGARNIENVFLIANNGFTFLQRGRVVITDRLHGHIMCVLLHVPHVLLDTSDHKVSKYHNTWTRALEGRNVLTAITASEALDKAIFLLKKYEKVLPEVDSLNRLKESVVL